MYKRQDSSRVDRTIGKGKDLREHWAVYNAQNTYLSVVLADSFLAEADKLRTKWRSQDLRIPAHSALDKLLDPVSYTHLDVYKRQGLQCLAVVLNDFEAFSARAAEEHDPQLCSCGAVGGEDVGIPVSYTHLDVYKRQVIKDPKLFREYCVAFGHGLIEEDMIDAYIAEATQHTDLSLIHI